MIPVKSVCSGFSACYGQVAIYLSQQKIKAMDYTNAKALNTEIESYEVCMFSRLDRDDFEIPNVTALFWN